MSTEIVLPGALRGLDPMFRRLAGLIDEPILTLGIPSTDIWTEGSDFVVQVQLANFDEKDVSVSLENGDLVVQAHHQESEKDKKKQYVVRETSNSFYRRVRLPEYAETDKITAEYKNGTLTVKAPLGSLPGSTKIPITAPKSAS
ncbi:Hsp20/alpha crystallin family protein [Lysinimonas soli]|uniref:Hsp20/alpha crystallin family protein n=1 Tax=Lysinimonas soli TaxID=1074233 RepID=A0ABW0NRR5_9MICO